MQTKQYRFHTSLKYVDSTVCFFTLKEMLKDSLQISSQVTKGIIWGINKTTRPKKPKKDI